MAFIDILLLVIVGAFVFFGLFFGLVHTIGSLAGTFAGMLVATHFIDPAFESFGFVLGVGRAAKVIVFILLFVVTSRLVGLVFWVIEKVFDFFSIIPFAKTFNRLLGGALGLVEGVVVVGVVLFYAMQILPEDTLLIALESSSVAKVLLAVASALTVLFPETLRLSTGG